MFKSDYYIGIKKVLILYNLYGYCCETEYNVPLLICPIGFVVSFS